MCHTLDCPVGTVLARGLCRRCYRYLSKLIAIGATTWEELEAKGVVLSSNRGKNARWPIDAAVRAAGITPLPPTPPGPRRRTPSPPG